MATHDATLLMCCSMLNILIILCGAQHVVVKDAATRPKGKVFATAASHRPTSAARTIHRKRSDLAKTASDADTQASTHPTT